MSPSRQFPKNPLRDRPDPFRDGAGSNPFSEGVSPPPHSGDNPYAAPAGDSSRDTAQGSRSNPAVAIPAAPVYEAWMPSRGGTILTYGIVGFVLSLIGALLCGPGMLASLIFTIAAVVMARVDLTAMRAGAMTKSGRGLTVAGLWLGLIGTVLTIAIGSLLSWLTLRELFEEM